MAYQYNDKSPEERFWLYTKKTDTCWLWTGYVEWDGYGRFRTGQGLRVKAHRYSWQIHYGVIPEKKLVCHKCDNPKCVNPTHLFLGTHKDNIQDMIKKGRKVVANKHKKICTNGHTQTKFNTKMRKSGESRRCLDCVKLHNIKAKLKRRGVPSQQ